MTKAELTKVESQQIITVDEKTVKDYLFGLQSPLNDKQQKMFLEVAKANNLNPFKREIYAVGFGESFSIITGYQVYIDKANATGLLNGWKCELLKKENGNIGGAKVIIYRKDWEMPFEWEVDFDEFAGYYYDKQTRQKVLNKIWATKGSFMIKKVAIGQGFRLCFPSELGSLPYLAEEIAQNTESEAIKGQIIEEEETEVIEAKEDFAKDYVKHPGGVTDENIEKEETIVKLPAGKVKQVQIKWREFAEKNGWNLEEAERKRKATIVKYFDIYSVNDLSVEQADDFVYRIEEAMRKIAS